MTEKRKKRVQSFINEAIEHYDKGDIKTAVGKLIWCIGWLSDEVFNEKEI